MVKEISETDISNEVVESVATLSEEDGGIGNEPNQSEDIFLVNEAETNIISSIETSKQAPINEEDARTTQMSSLR